MAAKAFWYTSFFYNVAGLIKPFGGWKASSGDVFKVLLTTSTYIPSQAGHKFKSDITSEVSGNGYTVGGQALFGKTIAISGSKLVLGADPISWTGAIFTCRYAIIYDDMNVAVADKQLAFWIDFGQDIVLNSQTLTLTFDGTGAVTVSTTPPINTQPPVFVSATIDTSTLIITYDRALNTSSIPAVSSFVVTKNGTPQSSPTLVTIAGSAVTLTTAAPVINTDVVILSYMMPASNPIKASINGVSATNLMNQAVQNVTVAQPLVDNSTFVSQAVPSTMNPGAVANVKVMMKNIGTSSWITGGIYTLESQNRIWTTNSVTVPLATIPGATCSFDFQITAPTSSGIFNFQWRMAKSGASFGDLSVAISIIIVAPAPTPTVIVVSPNGGENWNTGTTQSIQWTTSNLDLTNNVKIELTRDGGIIYETLFASTPNDGAENWVVSGATGSNNKIRISAVSTPAITDSSDGTFIISTTPAPPATITVVSPNGGENWMTGTVQTVRWSSANVIGNVLIELTRNGGGSYETLFSSTTNDGAENWLVSGVASANNLIRITSVTDGTVKDSSNAVFTIATTNQTVTRFFAGNSTWYTKIPSAQAINADSAVVVARIKQENPVLALSLAGWSVPIWKAASNSPVQALYAVTTTNSLRLTYMDSTGPTAPMRINLPIPIGAKGASQSDGHCVIISADGGFAWDFYIGRPNFTPPICQFLKKWNLAGTGLANNEDPVQNQNCRVAPVPLLHGLVTYAEIQAGVINHALAFATGAQARASSPGVYPCVGPDSGFGGATSPMLGYRFQLDPLLNINTIGLNSAGLIIAKALQDYGMIFVENSGPGDNSVYFEDLEYDTTRSWASLSVTSSTLSSINISNFRVVAPIVP